MIEDTEEMIHYSLQSCLKKFCYKFSSSHFKRNTEKRWSKIWKKWSITVSSISLKKFCYEFSSCHLRKKRNIQKNDLPKKNSAGSFQISISNKTRRRNDEKYRRVYVVAMWTFALHLKRDLAVHREISMYNRRVNGRKRNAWRAYRRWPQREGEDGAERVCLTFSPTRSLIGY